MKEEYAEHTVPIDSPESGTLSFGQVDEPTNQGKEEQQHYCTTDKTLLLADCTKDKVGILLRHIFQFRLCTFQEALARQTSTTYCNETLIDIVPRTTIIFLNPKEYTDARLLVRLQDVIECIVGTIKEERRTQCKQRNVQIFGNT